MGMCENGESDEPPSQGHRSSAMSVLQGMFGCVSVPEQRGHDGIHVGRPVLPSRVVRVQSVIRSEPETLVLLGKQSEVSVPAGADRRESARDLQSERIQGIRTVFEP